MTEAELFGALNNKNLTTVETLGLVNVICSDKTGTLTHNCMTLVHAGFLDAAISADKLKAHFDSRQHVAVQRLYDMAVLRNGSMFDSESLHLLIAGRRVNGDATDTAILRFAEHLRPVSQTQGEYRKLFEILFNSKNNSSAPVLLVEGAPDVLLPRCLSIQNAEGSIRPLDKASLERLLVLQRQWLGEGQRVLMLYRRDFLGANPFSRCEDDQAELESVVATHNADLCVVGLVGIVDPPRKEIPSVANTCRRADIRVFMVTGDFALTTAAIARQCHIVTNDGVDSVEDIRAKALMYAPGALADARYEKPEIKESSKGRAGWAAGGSEVAKEAADMVLLDNNFASIVVAIENGHLVFENLKKVLLYLLPAGSFFEFVPMLLNMSLGVPLPLSVIFMIIICMLTDVWASISLMYESPESDIMLRAPRNPKKEHLVDAKFFFQAYSFIGIAEALFAHIIFFVYMYWHGGFTPGQLLLAYDKWALGGFGGKDQATLNTLLSIGRSVFLLSLVIL
ncbi:hypothetical protein GGI20_003673 [Coemansia sp. BCRC 34301]|nr:hypothetical protein GGI20_003673 [Coemansia sp. BCRC 34301]